GAGGLRGFAGGDGAGRSGCSVQDLCGAAACGNNVRDTCPTTPPPGSFCIPPRTAPTETCDGTDLGGATCASLGYGSGTLGCLSWCEFDPSGCSECLVDEPRV